MNLRGGRRALIPQSAIRIPHSTRRGITLVELLITMAIMAIIAAAIMGTASAAMESARRSRTRTLITRISQLVSEQMSSYETRRIDVHPEIIQAIDSWANAQPAVRGVARGQMLADARLLAVRELIKLEMPDRAIDIMPIATGGTPYILSSVPALTQTYLRRYTSAQANENDSAELLYMVVMYATGDGEARTMFSAQDIGDEDEDGVPEFIDGWGQPIRWLRWPAGVISDLQPLYSDNTRGPHDPLDRFRRDVFDPNQQPTPDVNVYPTVRGFQDTYQKNIRNRLTGAAPPVRKLAFRLTPLIYSFGPDGESAYRIFDDPADSLPLDPYQLTEDDYQVGEVAPEDREKVADNITNHLMEY